MPFTVTEKEAIAHHLRLPPTSLTERSDLSERIARLEAIDADVGSSYVSRVKVLISQLNDIEAQLDNERADSLIGVRSQSVDGQYKVDFGNGNGGELAGLKEQYDKYVLDLKEYLEYEFDTYYDRQVGSLVI